jgi:hypothetical protein
MTSLRLPLLTLSALLVACPHTNAPDAGEDAATQDDAFSNDTNVLPDATPDAFITTDDAAMEDAATDAFREDAGVDAAMDAFVTLPDAPSFDAAMDTRHFLGDANQDARFIAPDASGDAGPQDAAITRMDDSVTNPPVAPIRPFATCTVTTSVDTISGAEHRTPCTEVAYPFYPPSSGPHFSQWASFNTYTTPVPWGFLVHSMEHGAVILAYNCSVASDCDAVRAEFASIIADRGLDPLCRDEDWTSRIIVVPDPTLTVPIAAVAWRNVYRATCLDPTSLRAFVEAHYGMASESLCVPGVDLSATTWCP